MIFRDRGGGFRDRGEIQGQGGDSGTRGGVIFRVIFVSGYEIFGLPVYTVGLLGDELTCKGGFALQCRILRYYLPAIQSSY